MDSLPLGGMVEMRTAEISQGDKGFVVSLFKDGVKIGFIDLADKSKYYADDVVENWSIGILKEDNEHIVKENN